MFITIYTRAFPDDGYFHAAGYINENTIKYISPQTTVDKSGKREYYSIMTGLPQFDEQDYFIGAYDARQLYDVEINHESKLMDDVSDIRKYIYEKTH